MAPSYCIFLAIQIDSIDMRVFIVIFLFHCNLIITDAWNLFLYSKNSTVNMILLHVKKDHFPFGVSAQILLLLKDPKLFFTKFHPWIRGFHFGQKWRNSEKKKGIKISCGYAHLHIMSFITTKFQEILLSGFRGVALTRKRGLTD